MSSTLPLPRWRYDDHLGDKRYDGGDEKGDDDFDYNVPSTSLRSRSRSSPYEGDSGDQVLFKITLDVTIVKMSK